eukprot:364993-Chlamydomonas_euryale.AAC.8
MLVVHARSIECWWCMREALSGAHACTNACMRTCMLTGCRLLQDASSQGGHLHGHICDRCWARAHRCANDDVW